MALKNLIDNDNLVIKSADKGGGVVILDKDDYIAEAHNILHNTEYYKILHTTPQ